MTDFLLELLSEEIPARMQAKAQQDLARLFSEQLSSAGLAADSLETYATPRRLVLIARGLPAETVAVREETKGPRTSAPPQALDGFLRKTGLAREQLVERDGIFFAIVDRPGRATSSVLAEAVPAVIRAFPWPKSMRWGDASASPESLRWVRPLHNILALFGEEIVDFEVAGVRSGAATLGHRFHHPGIITIGSAGDYAEKLRACHVVVDPAERRQIIRNAAAAAAEAAGLQLVEDEGLVAENAGLTEWPVPLLGRFDPAFLDVPPEVIQLTMRTNQKYFALNDGEGRLAPNFVCTANIDASDGGARIVAGNEKVLAARLSDARFFWEQDLKVPLDDQAAKLKQIVFHEKLGTVHDKVERVAKLARWLVEEGIVGKGGVIPAKAGTQDHRGGNVGGESPSAEPLGPGFRRDDGKGLAAPLADLAERAALLCKADLVTGMVGEFPELQGVIGGYLARAQGEPDEIADAIRDHYKPVGQGDEVPTAPVTVAVSLADKLDSLFSFFQEGLLPTGSKDPFALRRAALGVLRLIQGNSLRFLVYEASHHWNLDRTMGPGLIVADFLHDRLGVQLRESGIRYDYVQASAYLGAASDGDLCRVGLRARALQDLLDTENGRNLLAGYKRAANILKKEAWPPSPLAGEGRAAEGERGEGGGASRVMGDEEHDTIPQTGEEDPLVMVDDPQLAEAVAAFNERHPHKQLSYSFLDEEQKLKDALDSAEPRARAAVEAEDFEGAMAALASLRAPVDAFFDKVTVNDPDPAKREARLDLLARMRDAVHAVADFSRIEG